MEILVKHFKTIVKSMFFILFILSCKGQTNDTESKTVDLLPSVLANKKWIPYHEEDTYESLTRRIKYPVTPYVKTGKTSFFYLEGKMELTLYEVPAKKIVKKKDTYIMYLKAPYIDFITLSWVDNKKGILNIEYNYKTPLPIDVKEAVFTKSYIDESFVTPENFPELEEPKIILEEEKPIDSSKYERIKVLPIQGKFACKNEPACYLSFKYEEVKLRGKGGIIEEVQPYEAIISIDEYVNIGCSLRKVSGHKNKYVLFYKYTKDTKYHPEDKLYYSETHPIAEIEILENNIVKNKWIGMYNRRTKKVEDYDIYNWIDTCNNLLSKIED